MVRKPPPDRAGAEQDDKRVPLDQLPPELVAYMRRQHEDAQFYARLRATAKRWALAFVALLLTVTSGWDAVQKIISTIKALP